MVVIWPHLIQVIRSHHSLGFNRAMTTTPTAVAVVLLLARLYFGLGLASLTSPANSVAAEPAEKFLATVLTKAIIVAVLLALLNLIVRRPAPAANKPGLT
jgi:hypothetical protein